MTALADVRTTIADALHATIADDQLGDIAVSAVPVDAITAPGYLVEWADPMLLPKGFCTYDARVVVRVIGPRIDADNGTEIVEQLLAPALVALADIGLVPVDVSAPGPYEHGGLTFLASRVTVVQPTTITARAWSPLELPDLAAYYVGTDVVAVDAGRVDVWPDQGPNGFDVHPYIGDPARQPTTGALVNGHPVVSFNGLTEFLYGPVSVPPKNQGTWFAVMRQSSVSPQSYARVWGFHAAGADDFDNPASISAVLRSGAASAACSYYNGGERGTVSVSDDVLHVVAQRRDGDTAAGWHDGVQGVTNTSLGIGPFAFVQQVIGARFSAGVPATSANYWRGDIAALIWCNGALDDATVLDTCARLKAEYGTP